MQCEDYKEVHSLVSYGPVNRADFNLVTHAFSQVWIKRHSHKFEGKGCTAPPPAPPPLKPPAVLRVGVNGSTHSQKYSVPTY
jgi:hypothetical protein